MTLPTFPTLNSVAFPVTKTPNFSTQSVMSKSGREVVRQDYYYPLWDFELPYEVLTAAASYDGVEGTSYQQLLGFYLSCQSLASQFLYSDPTDYAATLQPIFNPNNQGFTGDGTTTTFTFTHNIGSYIEPVGQVQASGIAVYVNGTLASTSTYSVTGNTITFTSAPASGATLTATYSYFFVCRFTDDKPSFVNFGANLWSQNGLKFRSMKP